MSSNETNNFEVPDIFQGEVPESFYYDAIKKYGSPRQRAAGFLNRIFFKQPPEKIVNDFFVKSLYALAISHAAEAQARHDYEREKFDERTGLLNAKYVEEYGNELLKAMGNRRSGSVAVFVIDIVDFGEDINNIHGHTRGHEVLKEVAQFLQQDVFRENDIVGRYGGDEFLALVPIYDPSIDPRELIREIGDRLNNKIPFKNSREAKQIRHRAMIATNGMRVNDIVNQIDVKGKTEIGTPRKELAVYSRINPAYFSGDLSRPQSPREAA